MKADLCFVPEELLFFDFAPNYTDVERFISLSLLKFSILPFDIPKTVAILMLMSSLHSLVKCLEIVLNQEIIHLSSSHQKYMMFHLKRVSALANLAQWIDHQPTD